MRGCCCGSEGAPWMIGFWERRIIAEERWDILKWFDWRGEEDRVDELDLKLTWASVVLWASQLWSYYSTLICFSRFSFI